MDTWILISIILLKYIDNIQMSAELSPKMWTRKDDLSNRVFPIPMFSITTTRGRLQCATRCSENKYCRTMTFNLVTHVCEGYSGFINTNSLYTSNTGSECYQTNNPQGTAFFSYDSSTNLHFSLQTDLQNHTEAAVQCQQDGGALLKIDTVEKLTVVQTALRDYFNNVEHDVWLDGEDFTKTNTYIMGNGEAVPLTSALWVPGEPNELDEGCVGLYTDYKLNDFECYHEYIYLCEH